MDKDKKNELAKEGSISALRGLIGAIPTLGTALNEAIFETRSRIKQNRINSFVKGFSDYICQFNVEKIDISQIGKEEFGDFFEELILKVSKTRSEIKIKALQNLLVNQLIEPKEIESAELFLEIAGSLHEKQILILRGFNDNSPTTYIDLKIDLINKNRELNQAEKVLKGKNWNFESDENPEIPILERDIEFLKNDIERTRIAVKEWSKLFVAENFGCNNYDFYYLVQNLAIKGLFEDVGVSYGARPFDLVEITPFGSDLIDFIIERKSSV